MHNKKIVFALVLIVATALVSIGVAYWQRADPGTEPVSNTSTLNTMNDWGTYTNRKNRYIFHYPINTVEIGPLDHYDYETPLDMRDTIDLFSSSTGQTVGAPYVGIASITNMNEGESAGIRAPVMAELNKLTAQGFAERVREFQLPQTENATGKNALVSDIRETTIASVPAYAFDLSGVFYGGPEGDEYTLPNEVYTYIFFESPNGIKFMMWYPRDNEVSKKIVETLLFTER